MTKIKTYAIHSIVRRENGKKVTVPASTDQKITVFELDKAEFDKLQELGAVREASKDEVALANVRSNDAEDAPTNFEKAVANAKEAKTPASGAKDDKKEAPKGAAGSDEKKSETKTDVKENEKKSEAKADDI